MRWGYISNRAGALKTSKMGEACNNEVINMANIQSSKEPAFRKNKEAFPVTYA